jgi:hypothetical protein
MIRKLLLASALLAGAVGCHHHKCHHHKWWKKAECCPPAGGGGGGNPILLPPAGVPTTPSPVPSVQPGPSGYLPPPSFSTPVVPSPAPKSGPELLFPDPLPNGSSSRKPAASPGFLGAPAKGMTAEPPVVGKPPVASGLPGYTKVKDGLYAGGKPTLDGFDSLKRAGFRTVVYLHSAGADASAVKDMAATRGLGFIAIEATPETLAEATAQFNRVVGEKASRPAYVFGEDDVRAGAVWYAHFRTAEALGDDVARVRARALGLSAEGEGRDFALAIQRMLETR